jgi:stage V sporulation protein SpoVS
LKGIYSWKAGSHCKGDASKVGAELETIGEQVTPDSVVAFAAKNKKSELHGEFEWDNEKAGHLHRLNQARHLLSCIVIEREIKTPKGKKELVIARAFENVKVADDNETGKRVYVPIDVALTVPEHRNFVINGIFKAIEDLQDKARIYDSFLKNPVKFNTGLNTALKSV